MSAEIPSGFFIDVVMLVELVFVGGIAALLILAAWKHSIYRRHQIRVRAQWTTLLAVLLAACYANVRRAGAYLGDGCAAKAPGAGTLVTALLLGYLPVMAAMLALMAIIASAAAITLRRRYRGKPKMHAEAFKLLHKAGLRMFTLTCSRWFCLYHMLLVCVGWSVEPFVLLGSWHIVPPSCRDQRVFAICCAGVEVLLSIPRLFTRGAVQKELQYERALLQVDATAVRMMEVTTCTKCGLQFFGSPDKGLGLAGEGRAQFVEHFFSVHGTEIKLSDFKVEMRAAIGRVQKGGGDGGEPDMMRWHQKNDRVEQEGHEEYVEPGKHMVPNSRGQEIMAWRAQGQPAKHTPASNAVLARKAQRADEAAAARGGGESGYAADRGEDLFAAAGGGADGGAGSAGAGGLGGALRTGHAMIQRPSVVERWSESPPDDAARAGHRVGV